MKIPFYKQRTDWACGPTAIRMVLASLKIKKTETELSKLLGTTKKLGTKNKNFAKILSQLRLNYKIVEEASIINLKSLLKKQYRTILNYTIPEENVGHYAVLKKISKDKIYLLDPLFGPKHNYLINKFKKIWHSKSRKNKQWLIAIKKD